MVEVGALVSSIKATVELAKSAKDVNDQAKLNAAVSDIMEKLVAMQSELFAKQQENHTLFEEVKQLKEKIEKDKRFDQYQLEKTALGGYVLTLCDSNSSENHPKHSICPSCREDGRLSILEEGTYSFNCQVCKYTAKIRQVPPIRVSYPR
ncbi:hypothetical protein [Halomonas sp. QHL1]|uniref:hypothetical protein n=1 Tax=Halomonas sp. QHL1 TaxID=1123773 RepID=UPI0008FD0739|nr:hypothetical protein [Halomonas sp. QHL1]OJA04424.1 hypothetical protein QHL1GM_02905 [Halomonas sp. QHL1]